MRRPFAVLILRRVPSRGSIWGPVQGKVDPGDQSFEAALRREVREETGLERPLAVESLDWTVPFRVHSGEVWRLHAYSVEAPSEFPPHLSEEHDAFAWATAEEAERRMHFLDNRGAVVRLRQRVQGATEPPNV